MTQPPQRAKDARSRREPVVGKLTGAPARSLMRTSPLDQAHPAPDRFPTGWPIPDSALAGVPFASLDADLPLLLLPIRIETRYRLEADPPELRIRIFPDQVHIDADTPSPGSVEVELTTEFWTAWYAAADDAGRQAAWRVFVGRVGSGRAGHLARLLRPTQVPGPKTPGPKTPGPKAPGPTAPGPTTPGGGPLVFPPVEPGAERRPARPVLLPGQWLAVGYSTDGLLFSRPSRPVDAELRTAPDPQAPPWEVPGSGVVVDEGLAWMFDYDRAVEAGMAITVPLVGDAAGAITKVDTLLVVGVDGVRDATEAAAELDRLLGVHARTGGLAFVPQGTPTNNTETVTSGWTREERELADLAARELDPLVPVLGDNAARLASVLGLGDDTTLRRAAFGTDAERGRSRAMIRASFEAVLGTFVRRLLKVGDVAAIDRTATNEIRSWCIQWVTGGAPYSTLRVGRQPYGILPVRRSTVAEQPASTAEHVQAVISLLIDEWRRSAAALPVLDPDQADVAGEGEHETAIATILATQPHPARLFVRRLDEYASLVEEGEAA